MHQDRQSVAEHKLGVFNIWDGDVNTCGRCRRFVGRSRLDWDTAEIGLPTIDANAKTKLSRTSLFLKIASR